MKDIFQSRNFKLLIIVVVLLIAVMLYSATLGGEQNIFSSVFSFITTPIQKLSAVLSGSADEVADNFDNPAELKKENEAMKKKIRELTSSLIDYDQYKLENELYRDLLSIKEENPDFEYVPASVIARDSNDAFHSFTIDKGKTSGVKLYDPIITTDGIVGYVSEVGMVSSKVTTILDSSINVGVFDRRTRDGGVIIGDAILSKQGYTKMKYLKRDCDVTAGDIIVTSGLGGIFPDNLVIGEVLDVKPEAQDISLYAVIKPAADILECLDVIVLVSFDGQGTVVDQDVLSSEEVSSQP